MVSLREVKDFKDRINPTEEIEGRDNFGYYVIRPISLYFTWFALRLGLSANEVSVWHMAAGVTGSVMLGFEDLWVRLGGVLVLYFSLVIDNVDGEVARFRKQVSITGRYLDVIAHTVIIAMMFFCFGLGVFLQTGRLEMIVLGFLAGFFSMRFDVLAMHSEAAHVAQTHLDSNYEYYANLETSLSGTEGLNLLYISKRAASPLKRFVFALFAFPGNLNVIATVLLAEFLLRHLSEGAITGIPSMAALVVYGSFIPIRRLLTLREITVSHETERQYLKLIALSAKAKAFSGTVGGCEPGEQQSETQ